MIERISAGLRKLSTGWVALAALILFLLFTALVLPRQAATSEQQVGSGESPDTSLYYAPADLYRLAELYGAQGRAAYVRARFTFDLAWPAVYTFFLVTGIGYLWGQAVTPGSPWQRANLAPLLAALFDLLENLTTSLVMARFPDTTPGVDQLAPLFTMLKWGFVGASFLLLLSGCALAILSRYRRRAGPPPRFSL